MAYSEVPLELGVPEKVRLDLDILRKNIEDEGTARQHGDTLEKRGISGDEDLKSAKKLNFRF